MSWSDLFYPDNPGRRDEVVKLSQKLYDLLTENFRATNDLIDVLNDHMSDAKFSKITFQPEKSITENCELIRNRMREIQNLLDDKDRKLAESLEPDLYRKLADPDIRVGMRFLSENRQAVTHILGTAIGGLVLNGMKNNAGLNTIMSNVQRLGAMAYAPVAGFVLLQGIDMIIGAVQGCEVKEKLVEVIDELTDTIKTFEPVSVEYTSAINKVCGYVDLMKDPL